MFATVATTNSILRTIQFNLNWLELSKVQLIRANTSIEMLDWRIFSEEMLAGGMWLFKAHQAKMCKPLSCEIEYRALQILLLFEFTNLVSSSLPFQIKTFQFQKKNCSHTFTCGPISVYQIMRERMNWKRNLRHFCKYSGGERLF